MERWKQIVAGSFFVASFWKLFDNLDLKWKKSVIGLVLGMGLAFIFLWLCWDTLR